MRINVISTLMVDELPILPVKELWKLLAECLPTKALLNCALRTLEIHDSLLAMLLIYQRSQKRMTKIQKSLKILVIECLQSLKEDTSNSIETIKKSNIS